MEKIESSGRFLGMVIVGLLIFFTFSALCSAAEWSRKRKWEVFGYAQYMSSDSTGGRGIDLDLHGNVAGGLGGGYNLLNYVNLNVDLNYGRKNFAATSFGRRLKDDVDLVGGNFNVDLYLLKTRLTPMATGGIGFINFSGDVGSNDFNEIDFSYNVGGGIRWDITNHILLKVIYRATWTKLEDTHDPVLFHGPAISIGYIF
jgi:opacity protein-like surface antigen